MEPYLGLNYKMVGSENFEDLLIYLEKGLVERKIGVALHPVQSLRKNADGTYTLSFVHILASHDLVFTLGVEFEEVKPDGIKVQSLIEIDGNKLKHRQVDDKGRALYHVYEFLPDTLTITTTGKELKCAVKRFYKLKK